MRKIILVTLTFSIICLNSLSQSPTPTNKIARPKLIVGIVVDQMRWDFLYRYYERYGNSGFKRLLTQGYSCENTLIPYLPTYTAPGHCSIYTGSVPAIHGIISNNWYNRRTNKMIYCTEDTTTTVGSTSDAGNMSPRNMWTTTITDELRLATNFRSKVIGIALKDRGSILPAGHAANAAYWFDNSTGTMISSTYYMKTLPEWVNQFNNKKLPDIYLQQNWNTLYPINSYTESSADNKNYEGKIPKEDNTFPHETAGITKDKYNAFRFTPHGNNYTFDFAKEAIEKEHLGTTVNTDFLTISLSSTDYIGHTFGPNSIEIEDTYLRLDKSLSDFLKYLDNKIGAGNYTIFLTSDHGVVQSPGFLQENKIDAAYVEDSSLKSSLNNLLEKEFSIKNAILSSVNNQLFLSDSISASERENVKKVIISYLMKQPFIANGIDVEKVSETTLPKVQKEMLANGYNQKLSGDIQFFFKPQFIDGNKGTTHGAWNPYDAHIPLLWYGWGINKGKTNRETYMTDIAATLAALLHIQMPSGCVGKVITEVLK